jgi:hypothetical protein
MIAGKAFMSIQPLQPAVAALMVLRRSLSLSAAATGEVRCSAGTVEMRANLQPSGSAAETESPARDRTWRVGKLLRWCAPIAWGSWLLSIGLLWGQHQLRVLHPWSLLFLLLLAVTVLAALCGLAGTLWRVVRGLSRLSALAWGFLSLLPVGLWAALGVYVLHLAGSALTPKNTLTNIAGMAVVSFMELQAKYIYPHRMESERLVMFYDDRVTNPERDLKTMDQHVAELEALTGKPLREKIYWVRGESLGQRRMAFCGLVLGSSRSPANWETADHPDRLSEDRHELAHAVIHQLQPADSDAPTLLIEGWAEAHNGMTSQTRAEGARQSRILWRERTRADLSQSYLRELTGPSWYHRNDGPVYSVGGAFAEFLVRKYGTERFLQLYFACRPDSFEAECEAQFGISLDNLDSDFWGEVDRLAGNGA